jgi:hypothetical protein
MVEFKVQIALPSPAFLRILLIMTLLFNSPVIFSFCKKKKKRKKLNVTNS